MKVQRVISFYEKEGSELLNQVEIDADLDTLNKVWTPFEDDPMFYMSYQIDRKKAIIFKEVYNIELDLDRYDIFLECYSLD
ncbi:DUF7683 domain-containing protein [Parapedobacter sp. DT-150]|uniref:DUF7683 domain-containing protein n=1 Tax=Parapedobacter sp. DT-150 TaxID=3396162 RepID=UPI003F1BB8B3